MIRHIIGDSTFKAMMLEMNKRFYHKVTSSDEIEKFISDFSGRDLSKVFDQYLRTTKIPVLEWSMRDGDLFMRWANCVDGFSMPANIMVNGEERVLQVSQNWSFPVSGLSTAQVSVDRNWYVTAREAGKKALTKQEIRSLKAKASSIP